MRFASQPRKRLHTPQDQLLRHPNGRRPWRATSTGTSAKSNESPKRSAIGAVTDGSGRRPAAAVASASSMKPRSAATRRPCRNRVLSADRRRSAGRRLAASIPTAPGRCRPRRRLRDLAVASPAGPGGHRSRPADHRADLDGRSGRGRCGLSSSKPRNPALRQLCASRQAQGAAQARAWGRTTTDPGRMTTCEMLIACSACWNSWVDSPW